MMLTEATELANLQVFLPKESPLTDSNRRPPPSMEVQERYWRARPGTRGHVSPANRAVAVRLSCPPVPARAQADVPVSYPRAGYRLANRQLLVAANSR